MSTFALYLHINGKHSETIYSICCTYKIHLAIVITFDIQEANQVLTAMQETHRRLARRIAGFADAIDYPSRQSAKSP